MAAVYDGNGNGNNKENSKNEGTDDAGYGNATNAEEHNSQNQSGILFPIAEEISQIETKCGLCGRKSCAVSFGKCCGQEVRGADK